MFNVRQTSLQGSLAVHQHTHPPVRSAAPHASNLNQTASTASVAAFGGGLPLSSNRPNRSNPPQPMYPSLFPVVPARPLPGTTAAHRLPTHITLLHAPSSHLHVRLRVRRRPSTSGREGRQRRRVSCPWAHAAVRHEAGGQLGRQQPRGVGRRQGRVGGVQAEQVAQKQAQAGVLQAWGRGSAQGRGSDAGGPPGV